MWKMIDLITVNLTPLSYYKKDLMRYKIKKKGYVLARRKGHYGTIPSLN